MPVMELTMEQSFKMRRIEDALKNKELDVEDLKTVFIALQHQNFVLSNNVKQLLEWGTRQPTTTEDSFNLGTLFETKD